MKIKQELPSLIVLSLPFVYLLFIWNHLPSTIPVHWNINGEIDRYGNKLQLLLVPILLPLVTYLIFLIIPKIDPKNKLNQMGSKLQSLKLWMTAIMSILSIFIIYSAKNQSITNPNNMILLIGLLYIVLGNYFKTVKPNYFIGIRTPWTLENEYIWKETHKLGGVMWFVAGIIVVLSSLFIQHELMHRIFLIITVVISIIPLLYSYLLHIKQKKSID